MDENKTEMRTPIKAEVIKVIKTRALRGNGTMENPIREVIQFWDFKGNLLAESIEKNTI